MTKAELQDAAELAFNGADLSDVDDSPLHGLYLPDFPAPVHTTIPVVAHMMRDLCQYIMRKPGQPKYDADSLAEFCKVAKKRIRIVA